MTAIWAIVKRYWWVILIVLAVGGYIAYLQMQLHEKNSIIYYKDSIQVLGDNKYKTLAEQYQNEKDAKADLLRYNKELLAEIEKAKETINSYTQIVIKLKKQQYTYVDTTKVFNVINDTIRVPIGQDSVGINIENSLYKVIGSTFLYPHKGYDINFEGKEMTLDVVVTEDINGIMHSYVDVNNSDLELIKFNTRFLKQTPSFWSGFRSQIGANLTNKNIFLDVGVSYGHWGVKGIVGFDYQQQVINQQQLMYGGGITYSPF